MSGHSKWSSIKHKKAATDAKRGKIFTRHAKLIQIATREGGGGDTELNSQLAAAVDAAKVDSVPKENIERAIKKGLGEGGGEAMKEQIYEGYAPSGIALMITTLTDNLNRTVSDVRHALTKNGGKMAESGSVAFQFTKRGVISCELSDPPTGSGLSPDDAEMAALEAGAVDAEIDSNILTVYTDSKDLMAAKSKLEESGLTVKSAELSFVPNSTVEITDTETAKKVLKIIEALEELDDVSDVAANLEFDDTIIKQIN